MEQNAFKNVNYCWYTNISFYLHSSGGKSYNVYLNVVHSFNTSVNQTSVQTKTVVFLNRYLIRVVLLEGVVIKVIRKHIGKPKSATLVKCIVKQTVCDLKGSGLCYVWVDMSELLCSKVCFLQQLLQANIPSHLAVKTHSQT